MRRVYNKVSKREYLSSKFRENEKNIYKCLLQNYNEKIPQERNFTFFKWISLMKIGAQASREKMRRSGRETLSYVHGQGEEDLKNIDL